MKNESTFILKFKTFWGQSKGWTKQAMMSLHGMAEKVAILKINDKPSPSLSFHEMKLNEMQYVYSLKLRERERERERET